MRAEVVVERDHAMDFGASQIHLAGNDWNGVFRDIAEFFLDTMKYWQESARC